MLKRAFILVCAIEFAVCAVLSVTNLYVADKYISREDLPAYKTSLMIKKSTVREEKDLTEYITIAGLILNSHQAAEDIENALNNTRLSKREKDRLIAEMEKRANDAIEDDIVYSLYDKNGHYMGSTTSLEEFKELMREYHGHDVEANTSKYMLCEMHNYDNIVALTYLDTHNHCKKITFIDPNGVIEHAYGL